MEPVRGEVVPPVQWVKARNRPLGHVDLRPVEDVLFAWGRRSRNWSGREWGGVFRRDELLEDVERGGSLGQAELNG